MDPASGPGLLFMVLPAAFGQMPFGEVFLALFLLLFLFATLTSSFSLYEIIVAAIMEKFKVPRVTVSIILGVVVFIAALPALLSYSSLSDVSIFGRSIFDATDFLVSNVMLPLGNLLIAIFIVYVMKKEMVKSELLMGSSMNASYYKIYRFLMTFIVPVVILVVLIYSILMW